MKNLIKKENNELVKFFHNTSSLQLNKPFEHDVFLLETYIAGTDFLTQFSNVEPLLLKGDKVTLFREPNNVVDKNAIIVQNQNGNKLGYIPKMDNPVIARLMDSGKLIYGKIAEKKKKGRCTLVAIKIYMKD